MQNKTFDYILTLETKKLLEHSSKTRKRNDKKDSHEKTRSTKKIRQKLASFASQLRLQA